MDSHNNNNPSSRPIRSTRGVPPQRFGQAVNLGGGLLRTPVLRPSHSYSNVQQNTGNSEGRNDIDARSVRSVQSHHTNVTHRSQYSTASSTHSAANILNGHGAASRILQKASSIRSNVPQVNENHRESEPRRNDQNHFDEFVDPSMNCSTDVNLQYDPDHVNRWVEEQRNYSPSNPRTNYQMENFEEGPYQRRNVNSGLDTRDTLLSDAFKALTLNKRVPELPTFSGAIREWPVFFNEFKRSTKEYNVSNSKNLSRLHKALTDDARKAVLPLMTHPENVDTIIKILQKNFGQNEWVISTLIEDMKALPILKDNDLDAFRDFYNSVVGTVTTIKNMNCEHYLSNHELLNCLVQKLPYFSKSLWAHSKAELMRNDEVVTIHHFSLWLEDELDAQFASYTPPNQRHLPSSSTNQKSYQSQGSYQKPFQSQGSYQKKAQFASGFQKKAHVLNHSETSEKPCVCCNVVPRHPLYKCDNFMKLTIEERRDFAAKKALCYSCLSTGHGKGKCNSKGRCKECGAKHHTTLHLDPPKKDPIVTTESSLFVNENTHTNTLLRCGKVKLRGKNGTIEVFALFDDGSTASQMEDSLARELDLDGPVIPITYCWTRNITTYDADSRVVQTEIAGPGVGSKYYHLKNVRTVKNLSLPVIKFNMDKVTSLYPNIETEKLMSIQNAKPRVLIGSNNSGLITPFKSFSYSLYGLQLSHCRLGWTIHGDIDPSIPNQKEYSFHVYTIPNEIEDDDMSQLIKKSYEIEDFGMKIQTEKLSDDDQRAVDIMKRTMKPVEDRYEIGHLYKYDDFVFPESKSMALRRLTLIEKKMDADEAFCELYCNKIQEYVDKGYARKLKPEEVPNGPRNWYLPHFGVTNPNKPGKFRFVMDAKSKSHGYSLNDLLLKGPDMVPSLQAVLWRGRLRRIVMMADIAEMFHQVLIRKEDQCSQMFLFRGKDRNRSPDTYMMSVMIFGAVSSPSVAQFVKNENAKTFENETPGVYNAITRQHYVDDYFDSADDEDIAIKLVHDVVNAHKHGGFKLVKFVSNSDKLLQSLPEELRAETNPEKSTERILGLQWNVRKDAFMMSLKFEKFSRDLIQGEKVPTKREFLQFMMSIFDPLGFLSPIMIKLKLLYQDLWRLNIKWDCEIPNDIFKRWKAWLKETCELDCVEIPRCYFPEAKPFRSAEIHTFCDSSDRAFVAVVYLRLTQEHQIHVAMISSKAKVAPIKSMTVPKLELQAAVTGAILCDTIVKELGIDVVKKFYWTDSKVVLSWLKSKDRLNVFIGSRVSIILEKSKVSEWMWLPSGLNIADLATKEHQINQLTMKSWISGPPFLYFNQEQWPKQEMVSLTSEETINFHSGLEQMEFNFVHTDEDDFPLPDISRFSNFHRLIRTTAYYLKMRTRLQLKKTEKPKTFKIDLHDINEAKQLWYKKVQEDAFSNEIKDLKKTGYVRVGSCLCKFSPFLHDGIIRMNGRMPEVLNFDENNPIILPAKHPFTELLVKTYHNANLHVGVATVVNTLRQKYCILKCRQTVKRVFRDCNVCKQKKLRTQHMKMAPLPYQRTNPNVFPFTYVGIDYFGPVMIKHGRKLEKYWICMFTCLSIRAIHMEMIPSLTTNSCIMAIRRFMNIRGIPREFVADNGTYFIGSRNELKDALKELNHDEISDELSLKNVIWKFNCPAAPHQGGATERMIGSVKRTLRIILNEQHPTYEVMSTTLTEIMNVVNNRPLTHLLDDDERMCSLTPNDILLGRVNGIQSEFQVDDADMYSRKIWKCTQVYADRFWKRWIKEYRPEILRRTNWYDDRHEHEFKIGDLVMVIDESLKRGLWPKGRIEQIYRNSHDGKVRNVSVRCKDGLYRRPVNKLSLLEAATSSGLGE